jgi:hypothetical protein
MDREDTYDKCRDRAVKAASSGMTPSGAMLSAGVPLELVDRMRKGYASEKAYRERIDELLHAAWDYAHRMRSEVNNIRTNAEYAAVFGRPIAQELKRGRDIMYDLSELLETLQKEQDHLTGLAGMDESVISISLIKKRRDLVGFIEETDAAKVEEVPDG